MLHVVGTLLQDSFRMQFSLLVADFDISEAAKQDCPHAKMLPDVCGIRKEMDVWSSEICPLLKCMFSMQSVPSWCLSQAEKIFSLSFLFCE